MRSRGPRRHLKLTIGAQCRLQSTSRPSFHSVPRGECINAGAPMSPTIMLRPTCCGSCGHGAPSSGCAVMVQPCRCSSCTAGFHRFRQPRSRSAPGAPSRVGRRVCHGGACAGFALKRHQQARIIDCCSQQPIENHVNARTQDGGGGFGMADVGRADRHRLDAIAARRLGGSHGAKIGRTALGGNAARAGRGHHIFGSR